MDEFSVPVFLNDDELSKQALINSKGLSRISEYDDLVIHTIFPIKRGDNIRHNGTDFIIISDIRSKRTFEWKGIIRPATNHIPIRIQEEEYEIIDHDALGNPIYGDLVHEEIIEDVPCIIYQEKLSINGGKITIIESELKITMADNYKSQILGIGDKYTLLGKSRQIYDIDLFQQGLRIFTLRTFQ